MTGYLGRRKEDIMNISLGVEEMYFELSFKIGDIKDRLKL